MIDMARHRLSARVLIVDDDEDAAFLLRDILRMRRFGAEAMSSGHAALEYLRTRRADVVVTDLQMSGMSGLELCNELRHRHPEVAPIVLTGQSGIEVSTAAIRAGAYRLITKPVKIDTLLLAIEHLSFEHRCLPIPSHGAPAR